MTAETDDKKEATTIGHNASGGGGGGGGNDSVVGIGLAVELAKVKLGEKEAASTGRAAAATESRNG